MSSNEENASADSPGLSGARVLIMAGGASSRFFPVNKIFADPTGLGRTIIQQVQDLVTATCGEGDWKDFVDVANFRVVTGRDTRGRILEQLRIPEGNILVEPSRRNTWPATLWALAHLRREVADSVVAVLAADQIIDEVAKFRAMLAEAVRVAASRDAIVTMGVSPSAEPREWTSVGAIKAASKPLEGSLAVSVESFEEKPSEDRAKVMIEESGWAWNAGVFVFKVSTVERALAEYQPEMFEVYGRMSEALDSGEPERAAALFQSLPSKIPHPVEVECLVDNSIDFALMMPLTLSQNRSVEAYSIPVRFPWTDIGSWDTLRRVVASDGQENIKIGEVDLRSSRRSIFVAEKGTRIVAEGVDGLVVVHASDGTVLVTREDLASQIKPLVAKCTARRSSFVVFEDARRCLVTAEDGRVGVYGVEDLEICRRGNGVTVRALDTSSNSEEATSRDIAKRLSRRVLALSPVVNHYAWGGDVLPDFLDVDADEPGVPTSEAWLTSCHSDGEVGLEASPMTLSQLVRLCPEVLGRWCRTLFGDELPVFAKFLSTRFPARVHVGFRPGTLSGCEGDDFNVRLLTALCVEQETLTTLLGMVDPDKVSDLVGFERLRSAYEAWAIAQSESLWSKPGADAGLVEVWLGALKKEKAVDDLAQLIGKLRQNRAWLTSQFNEIDLRSEAGRLLLLEAGTPHAICGLSHQSHPRDRTRSRLRELFRTLRESRDRGESSEKVASKIDDALVELRELRAQNKGAPKNEAWLPFEFKGQILIAEPQQSSNTTYSWLDLFTPFVFQEGKMIFRKGDPATGVSREQLEDYLAEIDRVECEPSSLRQEPVEVPCGSEARGSRFYRIVDDPEVWPYFTVYRLDLAGRSGEAAECLAPVPGSAFQQLLVIRGSVRVRTGQEVTRLSPGVPAFVPATLSEAYTLESDEESSLLLLSIPTDGQCPEPPNS